MKVFTQFNVMVRLHLDVMRNDDEKILLMVIEIIKNMKEVETSTTELMKFTFIRKLFWHISF